MASRIGSDLRRARTRREIDLPDVEAATQIRVRFLAAIENEEWDVLPGGFYTRGFIRTYASYLGLDGDRLAADFKREVEGEANRSPAVDAPPSSPQRAPTGTGRRRRSPGLGWLALVAVLAVGAFAVLAIPGGDGGGEKGTAVPPASRGGAGDEASSHRQASEARARGVSMKLVANAEVWTCVLDGNGRRLVDGQILQAGEEAGSFRSGSFTVSLGNGEVTMTIDGKRTEIPPTASPVGYAIEAGGGLAQLPESKRPTCE